MKLRKLKTELSRQRDVVLSMDGKMLDESEVDKIDDDIVQSLIVQIRIQEALKAVNATLSKSVEIKPANESTVRNVKIPIIMLPKFSRAVLEWQHFGDLYETILLTVEQIFRMLSNFTISYHNLLEMRHSY